MLELPSDDPRATALVAAIHTGDVAALEQMLRQDRELATARIVDRQKVGRSLLHILSDWPGHRPERARTAALLVQHGADVDATVRHPTQKEAAETSLHWAASNDDVALIDALLDAGANIEIPGAIFTGGTPMSDAVVFGQWNAARRLLERGAKTTFWQAAALGLLDQIRAQIAAASNDEITTAFWNACRGGHRNVAELLLQHGADPHRIGPDDRTPIEAARESENADLIAWLRGL